LLNQYDDDDDDDDGGFLCQNFTNCYVVNDFEIGYGELGVKF